MNLETSNTSNVNSDVNSDFKKNLNFEAGPELLKPEQAGGESGEDTPIEKKKKKRHRRKPRAAEKFSARRRARKLAVQFLYSLDVYPNQSFGSAFRLFAGEGSPVAREPQEVRDYLHMLSRGTWDSRSEIDEILLSVVRGWRPERMIAVDRAVLSLIIFEGFLSRKLPVRSALAEAVELARIFGTENSTRFINGVLARVIEYLNLDENENSKDLKEKENKENKNEDEKRGEADS